MAGNAFQLEQNVHPLQFSRFSFAHLVITIFFLQQAPTKGPTSPPTKIPTSPPTNVPTKIPTKVRLKHWDLNVTVVGKTAEPASS